MTNMKYDTMACLTVREIHAPVARETRLQLDTLGGEKEQARAGAP